MRKFKVSDKVVPVIFADKGDDHLKRGYVTIGDEVERAKVYVVSKVIQFEDKVTGLALVGSSTFHVPSWTETGWDPESFRLLSEVQAENRAKIDARARAEKSRVTEGKTSPAVRRRQRGRKKAAKALDSGPLVDPVTKELTPRGEKMANKFAAELRKQLGKLRRKRDGDMRGSEEQPA